MNGLRQSLQSVLEGFRTLFLCLLLWSFYLNGCGTWKMVTPPPETDPASVHVTIRDSTRFELKEAFAREDTLFGKVPKDSTETWEAMESRLCESITSVVCDSASSDSSMARFFPEEFCDSLVTVERFLAAIQKTAESDTTLSDEEIEELSDTVIQMAFLETFWGNGATLSYSKEIGIPLSEVERIEQRPFLFKLAETTGFVVLLVGLLVLVGLAESYKPYEQ